MKKMILGLTLFVIGFLSAVLIVVSTVLSPYGPFQYNDIEGWLGGVLTLNLTVPLIVCAVVSIIGLVIAVYEAYKKSK